MVDKRHFKTISKLTRSSLTEIRNYDTFEEMLEMYGKKDEYYEIKFVDSINDTEMVQHFINGENQRKVKVLKVPDQPLDNEDNFLTRYFFKAAPSRRENKVELFIDALSGEDVSKPKIAVIKGGKE